MQAFNFSGISASGVQVWRGERHVLRGVSAAAAAGDCLHVAGPNGAGKTTLLRVLAGLLVPEEGALLWGGSRIDSRRDDYAASLSFLAHSDALKSDFTARENLRYEVGLRRQVSAAEITDALAGVGLAASGDQPARSLSAGQRRRVALARVSLSAAPLWILDEPFTNLDSDGQGVAAELIAIHLDAGGAAIMAAHQPPSIPRHPARRLDLAA